MDTNCTRLEDWLTDQPDAKRDELPAEWKQHVAECEPCARCWREDRQLNAAVVAWRATTPRPPAAEALVAVLLNELSTRNPKTASATPVRRNRTTWLPMLVASAALVVLAIGLSRTLPTGPAVATVPPSEQLALTTTVGSLLDRMEDVPQEMLTAAGQHALPAFPELPSRSTRDTAFEAADIIDPTVPSAVLRYGEPLGQGVGQAFRFLQIAVPGAMSDAG